ncbi:MAG: nucleotidyltransferase family protein [Cyclobacteriaceae bacterium]|nr:nucleotidyltransferase family protein [Cyclobacteriaceae bacterium]
MSNPLLKRIPILLLAAGSSSRMGQSKQLLLVNGKPLLQKTVEELLAANTGKVIVVLGANATAHRKIIEDYSVFIIKNDQWQNGMGSSVKAGLKYITSQLPDSNALIISVCDQPHLTNVHLKELIRTYSKSEKSIVASAYNNTFGVPVLFDRSHFEALSQIQDEEGAKKIIQQNLTNITSVPFPLGDIDLDTMEDYDTFSQ